MVSASSPDRSEERNPYARNVQRLWQGSKRYGLCMPGIMDAPLEDSHHETSWPKRRTTSMRR